MLKIIGHILPSLSLSWLSTKLLRWNLPTWAMGILEQPEIFAAAIIATYCLLIILSYLTWKTKRQLAATRAELALAKQRYELLNHQILSSHLTALIQSQNREACCAETAPKKSPLKPS